LAKITNISREIIQIGAQVASGSTVHPSIAFKHSIDHLLPPFIESVVKKNRMDQERNIQSIGRRGLTRHRNTSLQESGRLFKFPSDCNIEKNYR
ncbi:MAG: hypothetical protein WAU91_03695, partial [Desulfatitalea sp.]